MRGRWWRCSLTVQRNTGYLLLAQALQKAADKQLLAYTLTVKIKFHNFVQVTRSRTLPHTVTQGSGLLEELIKNTGVGESSVRLLGVALSSLQGELIDQRFQQGDLFSDFYLGQ
jgi:DNA polymerase IV